MSMMLLVPPGSEPLSLTEAKAFLRVEHVDDDGLITTLIAAARAHLEMLTRRALLTQTWRLVLDAWPPDGRLTPRIGPLRSLTAARVFDTAGVAHVIDVESFIVVAASNVIATPGWALPAPGRRAAGIELDVVCGFGVAAGDVPGDLRQALRMLLAHWYDNRGVVAPSAAVVLPAGMPALIAPYRMLAL